MLAIYWLLAAESTLLRREASSVKNRAKRGWRRERKTIWAPLLLVVSACTDAEASSLAIAGAYWSQDDS